MYTLKDNGVITEVICGNNFEYILEEQAQFLKTDYKVLQSQTNGIFVQCMKMTRNGKIALYYVTNDYRPMSTMFVGITAETLIAVAINLFVSVIEVRNNGFLACQSIDLSWDKIFVEQNTLKVRLVYLPISAKTFDSYAEFESELRSCVIGLITRVVPETTDRLQQFMADLSNGALSLEDVYNKSRNAGTPSMEKTDSGRTVVSDRNETVIRLVAMNSPGYFELVIDKNDVLIGKKAELVDKVIGFNNMISRKHCRILKTDGNYYICDEGSANGTFVNGIKLLPGQKKPVKRGDIIRLADSDFQIV